MSGNGAGSLMSENMGGVILARKLCFFEVA